MPNYIKRQLFCSCICIGVASRALACSPTDDAVDVVSDSLPTVIRVVVPHLDSLGPESINATFAVSRTGTLAFTRAFDPENRLVTAIDTSGQVVARFVRRGQGPGEIAGSSFIGLLDDNVLLALDVSGNRYMAFDARGEPRFTTRPLRTVNSIPLRFALDSSDVIIIGEARDLSLSINAIERVSLATLKARTLIDARDTSFRQLGIAYPLAASRGDIIVLANSRTYELVEYTAAGAERVKWKRDVPARFRTAMEVEALLKLQKKLGPDGKLLPKWEGERARLAGQQTKHIQTLAFDGRGRLWAIGEDTTGTAFGDVFADTTYLGRVTIPCKVAKWQISFGGDWMALMCRAPETDSGLNLQLFRVGM